MNFALQIGKIAGIPIRLHITFLAIIPVVAYLFGTFSELVYGKPYGFGAVEPLELRWIYSLIFSILLFTCVGLHELGHSFVAMRYGIKIRSITLYILGGVASMEDIPRDPSRELKMAIAGPLVSGIIGAGCILLSSPSATILGEFHPLTTLFWSLGIINFILMIFNLIPAFPMDGGRVLRAWFATRMPYAAATTRAANIGKMFAIFMGFLGFLSFNVFLILIAFFVYIGASEEDKATSISVTLDGIKVKDIMSSDVRTIDPETELKELVEMMFREKHRGYPVVQAEKLVGIVTISDVQNVPDAMRANTTVGQIMNRKIYVIRPEDEAADAMKKMAERQIRRLPVLENERLVGILSRSDLLRAIEICSGW